MSTKRIATNSTVVYIVAAVVIIMAFLLLGGGPWMRGMMHGGHSIGIAGWNWPLILICLGIGFLLGIVVSKRR